MKKGQIEIMGLVIIVILLVFIAIFALSFIIKPEQENENVLKLKANALRSSLLKTNLCGDITVKDEIENCVDGYHECVDECTVLKQEIEKMIKSSLDNEKYNFFVSNDEGSFINIDNCVDGVTAVSQNLRNSKVDVALCR